MAIATPPHRFTQMQLLTMTGDTDATRGFFDRSDIDGRFLLPTAPPPVGMWVPDRYVQTPQGDSSVVVPGHWERRLSAHEVYTPPFVGATPDGNVMDLPAGVRPPANERQAP